MEGSTMPIKSDVNPLIKLAACGYPAGKLAILEHQGKIKVAQSFKGLKISHGESGEVITILALDPVLLSKVKPGPVVKEIKDKVWAARTKVVSMFTLDEAYNPETNNWFSQQKKAYLATLNPTGNPAKNIFDAAKQLLEDKQGDAVAAFAPPKENGTPAMSVLTQQAAPATTDSYPILNPQQGDAVKLHDAHGLYQRVTGTDPGSVYHLVADYGVLKMAARWKSGKLSVRVEGSALADHAQSLHMLGLCDGGPNHKSIHLGVGSNVVTVRKCLGAFILGVELPLLSPLPDAMEIKS